MNDLPAQKSKRKILSLKLQPAETEAEKALPLFVNNDEAVYMVWRYGGDMPKKVYPASERDRAICDAKNLANQLRERFYVLRAFRGYDPDEQ